MGAFSLTHWLIVIALVALVFGRGRIATLMGDMAEGLKSFKRHMNGDDNSSPGSVQRRSVSSPGSVSRGQDQAYAHEAESDHGLTLENSESSSRAGEQSICLPDTSSSQSDIGARKSGMPMTLSGAVLLPADRAAVWAALTDAAVLRKCLPGCRELREVSQTEFRAKVSGVLGPVATTFKARIQLVDLDPPQSCRILGNAEGGVAAGASASAAVVLEQLDVGTRLIYTVDARVALGLGGQFVTRLGKRYADHFFARFADAVKST
jgi:uncharacterized protein